MRAPNYTPNQVDVSRPTGARFRAANDGGGIAGAIGEELQDLGREGARFADAQDAIDDRNDRTQARLIDSETTVGFSAVENEFAQLQAGAARKAQSEYSQRLTELRDKALEQAATPRMRAYVEASLTQNFARAEARISAHAVREAKVEQIASFDASIANISTAAAGERDPARRDEMLGQAVSTAFEKLELQGFTAEDSPEVFAAARLATTSPVHQQVIDRMLASPDPQLDEIAAYVEAYEDEMTPGLVTDALEAMKAPLQRRITRSDANLILSELGEDAVTAGTRPQVDGEGLGEWQGVAVNVANKLGLDPADVAAVMSYETGGTFSPTIMGGKGGRYMGLIQFGEWERKKYGIDKNSTPADWERAILGFMNDRGFKRGMGLLDFYSTINAGSPGRYGASDGPGNTVRGHVDKITTQHRAKAMEWLGGSGAGYTNSAREWDREAVLGKIEEVAQREEWSPERTERARDQLISQMNDDEALLGEKRRDAANEAARIAAEMGDQFVSVSQLPKHVRDDMDPTDLAQLDRQLQDAQQARREAAQSAAATSQWNVLRIMQRTDPERFMELDPLSFIGKISEGNFTQMVIAQQQMRDKPQRDRDFRSAISKEINWQKKYNQTEIDDEDFPGVFDAMDGYLRGLDRKPTAEDVRKAWEFANGTVPTKRTLFGINTGIDGGGMKIFEIDKVPDDWARRFRQRMPDADDAEVLRAYRLARARAIQ